MDDTAALRKFEELQKNVPFLERFIRSIKVQAETNEEYAKKHDKIKYILRILNNGYERNYTISFLQKLENGLQLIIGNISSRYTVSAQLKSERIDSDSVKMENDFQSPESPPMEEFKNEAIKTIPTERHDGILYLNDSRRVDPRRRIDKYDEYRRSNDRFYRGRSRSKSRSGSPSYDWRHDRKRLRHSRSNSRERERIRSKSRDRRMDRSHSPSFWCDSSPYQNRSKSPHHRFRHDRRDDRRYDRDRDCQQADYDRIFDNKRHAKREFDIDDKRDTKWHIKQESLNRRDNRDEIRPSKRINPLNPFGSCSSNSKTTFNRQFDNISPRADRVSVERNSIKTTPMSRFTSRIINFVDESDVMRDNVKDEDDINELQRKTQNMFGVVESSEQLRKAIDDLDQINKIKQIADEHIDKTMQKDILNELEANGEFDSMLDNEPLDSLNQSQEEFSNRHSHNESQTRFYNNTRDEVRDEVRNETHNDIRSNVRNDGWNELGNTTRTGPRNDKNSGNFGRSPDARFDIHSEKRNDIRDNNRANVHVENRSEIHNTGTTSTATVPTQDEERIALKYLRRKRTNDTSVNTSESNQQIHTGDPRSMNLQQTREQQQDPRQSSEPQQDPRLRNRPNAAIPMQAVSLTEQFISFGKPQIQQHHSTMQNAFGPQNFNRNHQQIPEAFSPPQRPFFNEPFLPHQQQQPPIYPNRPMQQVSPPSNNFSPNINSGSNAMPQHSRSNQFHQNLHQHSHPHQRHNQPQHRQNQHNNFSSYGEYRKHIEEKKRREAAAAAAVAAASVSSTTPKNTASEQNKEPSHESSITSPNHTESMQNNEKTSQISSNTAKKTHFDKAFGSNNWEALPQSKAKSNSFKIPKLNKTTSNSGTIAARNSPEEKRDSSENNISTTNATKSSSDKNVNESHLNRKKTSEPENKRKSTDSKKTDDKKTNEKKCGKKVAKTNEIQADTTIVADAEQVPEEPTTIVQPQKEDILEMIKAIVDSEKVDLIKKIIEESNNDDAAVTSSTQPTSKASTNNTTQKSKKTNQPKVDEKTTKKTKRYLNELERLTADIRENIPDVLSATGRRTCTLQTSNENSPTKLQKSAEKSEDFEQKTDDDDDQDKPKRIVRRRNTTVDSISSLSFDQETSSESSDIVLPRNRINRQRDTISERNMNSMIDSDEEKDMSLKDKSGPKCAAKKNNFEITTTKECSVVLETVDVEREIRDMQRVTRSSKRKAQQIDSGEGSESSKIEEMIEINKVTEDISTDSKRQKVEMEKKNTDPEMTVESKICHICNKNQQRLSSHYANMHDNIEVYCARMPPKNADKLRKHPAKDAVFTRGKLKAYCYYCDKDVKSDRSYWVTHLVRHTGEYRRFCTKCGITVTSNSVQCGHGDFKIIPKVEFEDTIYVYMCNICNYTQSQEENLKNHIRNMHEINQNVTSQYKKYDLIPNFRTEKGKPRTIRRIPSTSSQTESVENLDELINQDVFKSSNQDDEVLSDAFNLIKDNSFNNSESVKSTATSIVDKLSQRFRKQQQEKSQTNIKEEPDTHDIIFRTANELYSNGKRNDSKQPNPLGVGDAVEDGCKIEVNKTEINNTTGIQSIDVDEDDWESCSSDEAEENASLVKPLNSLNLLLLNKQKTNKRTKSKKRADKSLLLSIKKEKLDDVIDDIRKSPIKSPILAIRPVQSGQLRVDNIAYNECLGSERFNCYIGNCDFLSLNNPKSLATHLRTKHPTERWRGYCHACDKQMLNGNYSLLKEYDHMIEVHAPNHNVQQKSVQKTTKPPQTTSQSPPQQSIPQVVTPTSVATQKQPDTQRPPVIRVRPLSDMTAPSTSPSTSNAISTNVKAIPQIKSPVLKISNVISMPATQPTNPNSSPNDQAVFDNPLKPWTKCVNNKTITAQSRLNRECSLIALFKCMANDCIFSTSDRDKMTEHLNKHEEFLIQQASYSKHHSCQDDSSWLECCYCDEIPGSCNLLVEHIINEHETSIFQCPFCFYRSVDRYNVSSHMQYYHKDRSEDEFYIQVCGTENRKNLNDEIQNILKTQNERVKMVICPEADCNATFVHIFNFRKHMQYVHGNKTNKKCPYCPRLLNTLSVDCEFKHLHEHGFSLCHCAYCQFHSMDVASMHAHLRDEHPTKLPYSFVRIANDSPNTDQEASIAYFGDESIKRHIPVCSSLTEAQLNFMNPSLSEYASNANDPPPDDPLNPTKVVVDKIQFNAAQKLDEFETKQIRQKYYIKSIDLFFSKTNRQSMNVEIQPEASTSSACNTNSLTVQGATDYVDLIQNEIDSAANTIVNQTGVDANELYRCAFTNCNWVRSDEREFLAHMCQHQRVGEVYTCFHCNGSFSVPIELKNHMKVHLKHRFFCFYCDMTSNTQQAMDGHFGVVHKKSEPRYVPLNPQKYDFSKDLFVVCPKDTEITPFITRIVSKVNLLAEKTTYMPEEIDLLPKRQIFTEEIRCGRCFFSNKVRSNLIRHFKNGCIEQQAPVNPVPCLNSNERHFDKMRNLAASSNSSDPSNIESALSKYVPEEKRYVCGAKSCQYQTLSADMLQGHIVTLHGSENDFVCPHCGVNLSNTSATEILNHLRYHDSKIFKCPNCQFVHYLKLQVEKHITETHSTSKERALTLERPLKKAETIKFPTKTITYKWICNICSKFFNTKSLAKCHLYDTHRLIHQYQCSICSYPHDTKGIVKEHMLTEHQINDPAKIKSNFERVESEADNSPIWRRDDPTRVKHIRGILFDDTEKSGVKSATAQSNKNQSIHLEIKPAKFAKPTTTTVATTNKKSRSTQDDSIVSYKVLPNNNLDADAHSGSSNESDCFIILPPKESVVEEEIRPRPASLRQQPKRRFSTFIPSASEVQSSTSTSQPPISLRLKRVSDPLSDEQKMPPPKLIKSSPVVKKVEIIDLSTLDLLYVCNYCKMQFNSFDEIYEHWLNIHKKNNQNDAIAKRFCYRVTKRVMCLLCTADVTFRTIRAHMDKIHPGNQFSFGKYERLSKDLIKCGICSANASDVNQLQNHFRIDHPQSQRPDMRTEPLPMLNDTILEALLQQGDRGTFKCGYCCRHFPCRFDYEQHHQAVHGGNLKRYETNGIDVIKYACNMCRDIQTDENLAIVHSRRHLQQWFQCLYCPKKVQHIKLIKTHHELFHSTNEIGFRVVNAVDNLSLFYQMTLIFSNGLALTWGDVLNTKYGGIERLAKYINELNEVQRQEQLKVLKASNTTTNVSHVMSDPAGKVNRRRQTLL